MSSNKEMWLVCNDMGVWNMEHEGDYNDGDVLLHITVNQEGRPNVRKIETADAAPQRFFVFKHAYNAERSWWEPWHNSYNLSTPEPVEAESEEALLASLKLDGLYSIFKLDDLNSHFEVQVNTVQKTERQVIRR